MSTHTLRFTESAALVGSKVNRDQGYIDDVLICGFTSLNGRDYLPEAFRKDYAVYEGARVNCNHAALDHVERVCGWFTNVRTDTEGKPRGRFNVMESHPMANSIYEAAERNPSLYGMSHVASCKTRRKNGRDQVESIDKVHSVDLVVGPATTKGFFESVQHPGKPMKFREYIDAALVKFPASASLKSFREMDGMDSLDMPADAPAVDDSATDDDPVVAAIMAGLHGLVSKLESGDLDTAAFMGKVKELIKLHDKSGGKETPAEEPAEAAEQAKRLAKLTVENMALRAGVTLTPVQAKAVFGLTDDADRKALVESFKAARAGEKPQSGQSTHGGNGGAVVKEQAAPTGPTWYEPSA